MQALILSLQSPSNPGVGSKDQNNFLSGNGHIAYQIEDNDTYNNMQAIILSLHASSTPGVASKHFLSKSSHAAYQTKGMKHAIIYKQIFCPYTHP